METELLDKLTILIPLWESKDPRRAELAVAVFSRLNCYYNGAVRYIVGGPNKSRSATINWLAAQSQTEYSLVLDADTIPDKYGIEQGVALMEAGVPWVIPYGEHSYYNLDKESSDRILENPCGPIVNYTFEHRLTSWSGAIMFRNSDFQRVGGFDERFIGWGHEDVAFMIRFNQEVGPYNRVPAKIYHLWHEKGEDTFGSPDELRNRAIFEKEYKRKYGWRDPR
jgi:GT2 family glycosyltransferase